MRFSSALAVGAVVSATSAFLIPPPADAEWLEGADALAKEGFDLSIFSGRTEVEIECQSCPFRGTEESAEWEEEVDSTIHISFQPDERGFNINGQHVWPVDFTHLRPVPLEAVQTRSDDGTSSSVPIDFALEILDPVESADTPSAAITPLRFTILGLAGHPVQVDTFVIDLVQSEGQTAVAKYERVPYKNTPGATECQDSPRFSLCRIKAMIAAHIKAVVDAAKAKADSAKAWARPKGGCPGKAHGEEDHHGPPGHHRGPKGHGRHGPKGPHGEKTHHGHKEGHHHEHKEGHHHKHKHHKHHRFFKHWKLHRLGHMLHQTLKFFVIPALLGVVGGLTASALGMCVGQMIIYVWIRFVRGGRRADPAYVEVAVEDESEQDDESTDSEKVGLIHHMPPEYEDAVDEKN